MNAGARTAPAETASAGTVGRGFEKEEGMKLAISFGGAGDAGETWPEVADYVREAERLGVMSGPPAAVRERT